MANVLVNAPKTAKKGHVVEIKALIMHVMETGYRPGTNGRIIPRNIIERFVATWNGTEIFRMEFSPAIAANPSIAAPSDGSLPPVTAHHPSRKSRTELVVPRRSR